jgi:hypothetical protein
LSHLLTSPDARIAEINKFVTTDGRNPVKVDALAKAFPWSNYLATMVDWLEARTQELQGQIAAQGGIDHIVQCIQEGDKSPLDYQPAQPEIAEQQFPLDPDLPGVARSQPTPGRRINPNVVEEIRRLKAMQREKEATHELDRGSAQLAAAAVSLGNAFQESFEQGPVADDNMSLMTDAQTQQVLSTLASQARESNKENIVQRQPSLLDRQANARKVPFNSQSPGKRARDDDDDEDEFETDSRPVKQVRRGRPPRSSLPQSTPGPSAQAQGQFSSSGPFATQPIPASRELMTYAAPASTAPVRTPASPNSPLPRSSQWQEANAAAKLSSKYHRDRLSTLEPQTKIQNRRAWSAEETERLMELIALNGPAYSKILTDDRNVELYPGTGEEGDERPVAGALQGRNQVQLKDKARNVKLDFIK